MKKNHNRYKYLNPKDQSERAPYASQVKSHKENRPNLKLTKYFSQRNAQLMWSQIQKNKKCFNELKPLLYGALLKCDQVSDQKEAWKAHFENINSHLIAVNNYNTKKPWNKLNPQEDIKSPKGLFTFLGFNVNDLHLSLRAKEWLYFQGEEYTTDQIARIAYLGGPENTQMDLKHKIKDFSFSKEIDFNKIFNFYFYNKSYSYYNGSERHKVMEEASAHLNNACNNILEKQKEIKFENLAQKCNL